MAVFRWIIGVLAALFVVGSALSFVLFMILDIQLWLARARRLRHFAYLSLLFWFNAEIWGRVIYTLVTW
jgi:hypothetical protein